MIEIPSHREIENRVEGLVEYPLTMPSHVRARHDVVLIAVDKEADRLSIPFDGV